MKYRPSGGKVTNQGDAAPIRTSIMELLYAISTVTKDEKMVLAVFRSIFDSYDVRLAHSLDPVRLVDTNANRTSAGRTWEKRHSAWA